MRKIQFLLEKTINKDNVKFLINSKISEIILNKTNILIKVGDIKIQESVMFIKAKAIQKHKIILQKKDLLLEINKSLNLNIEKII